MAARKRAALAVADTAKMGYTGRMNAGIFLFLEARIFV
jgi:hypothetical protein